MGWTWTPYTVPLLVPALVSAALACYGAVHARRRGDPVYVTFTLLLLGTFVWSALLVVRLSVTGEAAKTLASRLNVAPGLVAVAWFAFAAAYTGREEWLTRRRLALLASEPVVFGFVGLPTNGVHRLIVVDAELAPAAVGGFRVLVERPGPWFWLHLAWSYALVLAGIFLVVRMVLDSRRIDRGQAAAMLVGAATPLAVNAAHLSGLSVDPNVDPTPVAFVVSGVAFWFAISRYGLLELVPVARDTVIENMREGYLVLDGRNRVVDRNPAAERLLGFEGTAIGRPAADLLPDEVLESLPADGEAGDPREVVVERRLAPAATAAGDATRDAGDGREAGGSASDVAGVAGSVPDADGTDPSGGTAGGPADRVDANDPGTGSDGDDPGDGSGGGDPAGAERRYLSMTVSPLAEDGQFVGTLVSLRDVTERRAVERRYQALIEESSDLITVLDADGEVTYQSPSIERVLGIAPESVVGTRPFDRLHPEDREQLRGLLEDPGRQGEPRRFEFRIRDAAGEWRVFEGVGRNLLEDPLVGGVVLNSRDVTERVARERTLQRRNERLEEFAAAISSDLRESISEADAHVADAFEDPGTHVPEAIDALDRVEETIGDILTLARQGETVEGTESLDLETVARDAWAAVDGGNGGDTGDGEDAEDAGDAGDAVDATLVVEESRELDADETRLLTLLENCLRNALDHGDEGVTVRVFPTAEGFAVADDGPGIPPGEREEVFEAGYTTREEGTGFGLAIVERIAEAHGWSVSLTESREGGVRLSFDLTGDEGPAADPGVSVADD